MVERTAEDADRGFRLVGVVVAEVGPVGVLAGDAPVALGDGVDGHDLRVAGKGDVLEVGFFKTEGFEASFLDFVNEVEFF